MLGSGAMAVMGDGGFWHNGLLTGVRVGAVQRRRRACW
jgi:TPP-dependent indolepyruvate ferredoxin oxidoreductase alpha subunit